jgi:hypothetical protein
MKYEFCLKELSVLRIQCQDDNTKFIIYLYQKVLTKIYWFKISNSLKQDKVGS